MASIWDEVMPPGSVGRVIYGKAKKRLGEAGELLGTDPGPLLPGQEALKPPPVAAPPPPPDIPPPGGPPPEAPDVEAGAAARAGAGVTRAGSPQQTRLGPTGKGGAPPADAGKGKVGGLPQAAAPQPQQPPAKEAHRIKFSEGGQRTHDQVFTEGGGGQYGGRQYATAPDAGLTPAEQAVLAAAEGGPFAGEFETLAVPHQQARYGKLARHLAGGQSADVGRGAVPIGVYDEAEAFRRGIRDANPTEQEFISRSATEFASYPDALRLAQGQYGRDLGYVEAQKKQAFEAGPKMDLEYEKLRSAEAVAEAQTDAVRNAALDQWKRENPELAKDPKRVAAKQREIIAEKRADKALREEARAEDRGRRTGKPDIPITKPPEVRPPGPPGAGAPAAKTPVEQAIEEMANAAAEGARLEENTPTPQAVQEMVDAAKDANAPVKNLVKRLAGRKDLYQNPAAIAEIVKNLRFGRNQPELIKQLQDELIAGFHKSQTTAGIGGLLNPQERTDQAGAPFSKYGVSVTRGRNPVGGSTVTVNVPGMDPYERATGRGPWSALPILGAGLFDPVGAARGTGQFLPTTWSGDREAELRNAEIAALLLSHLGGKYPEWEQAEKAKRAVAKPAPGK